MASPLPEGGLLARRFRVGAALPSPGDLARHAVVDEQDPARALEVVTPRAHARLRPGARAAFVAPVDAPPRGVEVVSTVEHDGFPVQVRERLAGVLDEAALSRLDDEERAALLAWLGDDATRPVDHLWLDLDGHPRLAPTGTATGQRLRPPPTLAGVLGTASAGATNRTSDQPPSLTRLLPAPHAENVGQPVAATAPVARRVPAYVVLVNPGATAWAPWAVAAYAGAHEPDVQRAAAAEKPWAWAAHDDPVATSRARRLAARLGLQAEVVATGAPAPSFWPASVAALGAQFPVLVGTGVPVLDYALTAGLALAAAASVVRHGRRVGPARRAARALGALDLARRSTRAPGGPDDHLRALGQAIRQAAVPDLARADLALAVDEAWFALLSCRDPAPRPRDEQARLGAIRALVAAVEALHLAVREGSPSLPQQLNALKVAAERLSPAPER